MSERKGFWRRLISGVTTPITGNDFAEELLAPKREQEAYEAMLRESKRERQKIARKELLQERDSRDSTRRRNEVLVRPYVNDVGYLIDGLAQAYFGEGQYGKLLKLAENEDTNEVARWEAGRIIIHDWSTSKDRIITNLGFDKEGHGKKEYFSVIMRYVDNELVFFIPFEGEPVQWWLQPVDKTLMAKNLSELRECLKIRFRENPKMEHWSFPRYVPDESSYSGPGPGGGFGGRD